MDVTPENNSSDLDEVDTCIASQEEEEQQRSLEEKAASAATRKNWFLGFTIFHFVVAFPKWSMPIFLYCASRAIPLPPNFSEAVRKPVAKLSLFVRQESSAYHECTVEAFQIMNKELLLAAEKEYRNVFDRLEHNQMLLDQFGVLAKSCSVAGDKAREAMHHWAVTDNQTLHFLNGSCPYEDQSYIATSLGQGIQAVENEVSSVVGGYVDTSESSFDRVRDYATDRTEYDYNYFLRDRIHPVLELLKQLDVSQLHVVEFSINVQDIVDQLLALLRDFEVAFQTAQIRIQRLQVRLEEFYESIRQFLEHYNELYDRMKQTVALLRKMVPSIFSIPDYATMKGIQIGDTFLPAIFAIPEFPNELPNIDLLLGDFSTKALRVIADLVEKLAEEAAAAVEAATEAVVEQIRELLTLEDYDPPKYKGSRPEISSLEEEASYLSSVGEATQATALLALKKVQDLATWSLKALPTELPDFDTGNSSFGGNTTSFNYQEPEFPDIGIPEWIVFLVNALLSYKIWVDSVVQLIRLFLVKRKYERLAQPEAHEINYYAEEESQESRGDVGGYMKAVAVMAMTVAQNLFSCWLIVFLCILPFAYIAVVYYLPHVNENCLLSDNGTLSVSLVAPLMINHASARGNAVHLKGEFDCRLRQKLLCDRAFTDSDALHQKDLVVLSNLQQQYNQSQQWNLRLERCIETGLLDSQFQHACCGLEGYGTGCLLKPALRDFRCPIDELVSPPSAFRPLRTYVSDKTCKVNTTTWELKDARFDCQVLEKSCSSTPCSGVDEDLIHAMVTEADCMVHLYWLRVTFFVAIVLYHAVMLNIITTFLTNSATALYRHKLIDQDRAFKVQLAAGQDGKFTQLEEEIQGRIKKDAETTLKRNTTKGRLLLIMSFAFSVFYGISIWFIEDLASPLK